MINQYLIDALAEAKNISMIAHANQTDKAGLDYFIHPTTVSNMLIRGNTGSKVLKKIISHLTDEFLLQARIVAYLHDVIEDTEVTYEDLHRNSKLPYKCTQAVSAMTKRSGEEYKDYINRVRKNKLASIVKIADMLHNSDLSRLEYITKKYFQRKAKYKKAINYLSSFSCEKCRRTLPLKKMGEKTTRIGEVLCNKCLVKYELSWDEYEDFLRQQ